jgi:hypothetical protein
MVRNAAQTVAEFAVQVIEALVVRAVEEDVAGLVRQKVGVALSGIDALFDFFGGWIGRADAAKRWVQLIVLDEPLGGPGHTVHPGGRGS